MSDTLSFTALAGFACSYVVIVYLTSPLWPFAVVRANIENGIVMCISMNFLRKFKFEKPSLMLSAMALDAKIKYLNNCGICLSGWVGAALVAYGIYCGYIDAREMFIVWLSVAGISTTIVNLLRGRYWSDNEPGGR
jgi:hypothetical protein